jgi:L-aspartate oxidase
MYDYIIVGSGLAGLFAAILAAEHGTVLLLTKETLEQSNTWFAQGGIAAAVSEQDSPELHMQDTLVAGAGLADRAAVRVLTEEGPCCVAELRRLGVPFDTHDGAIALGLEGAHSVPRVLHAGGDATGARIAATLMARVREAPAITVAEHCFVTELLLEAGRVMGVRALAGSDGGREVAYYGQHVVLATGGAGQLYLHTSNPAVATADGVALAFRAGAAVGDMEFFQFHPTVLALDGAPRFLISEAVRGEGAVLLNAHGERFMPRYHERAELAPRDVVARAILAELMRTGSRCVYLDITHRTESFLRRRFPTIFSSCERYGLNMARERLPVAPAAHYFMGGVRTNLWGETSLPGLYACGEVANTRVHGANRLASNSLLEALVFARRIVQRTLGAAGPAEGVNPELRLTVRLPEACSGLLPALAELQQLMWEHAGMVRHRAGLEGALAQLDAWLGAAAATPPRTRREHELANLLLTGRLVATAALMREESRGAHYRTDFPAPRDEWRHHIVLVPTGA